MAIVASAPAPEIVLALFCVGLLVVGGTTWSLTCPLAFRLAGPFVAVIAVRLEAGSGAAVVAALLVALGAWLRVRMADATVGFAAFAGVVAVLGDASLWVVATFWLLGAGILLARSMVAAARRRLAGRFSLKTERTQPVSLGPES
jgi:hypothetical protein